jgi:hypothetical protein
MENEKGGTRSSLMENWLWKKLWTCRKADYRDADKSLARLTSRCILFDGKNISFDASLVLYTYVYIYIYI